MTAVTGPEQRTPALLVTADGAVFAGEAAGAAVPVATGELVFNTAMSGYQEVITDPSYAGQVIAFTSTHIGNYGTNAADDEARRAALPRRGGLRPGRRAVELAGHRGPRAVPAAPRRPGHDRRGHPPPDPPRARRRRRALRVRHGAGGELRAAAAAAAGTDGMDLVSGVTASEPSVHHTGGGAGADAGLRVVAYDFGVKTTMVQLLTTLGTVTVVPAATPADEVLALEPDGVFLSNGPGDPAALPGPTAAIADLVGRVPDLRHLPRPPDPCHRARRARTYKLPFGHHGANHPVQRLETGVVEITSQNHNYAVAAGSIPDAETTHVNLNDGVVEGFRSLKAPAFSVQYHPEAAPGPHDARYLFGAFRDLMLADPPQPRAPGALGRDGSAAPCHAATTCTSILVIGSGPIVIGQACEFDYSGTQACRVLREEGYRVVLANSNPATIMTDPGTADRTYVEPLDADVLTCDHREGAAGRAAADARRADRAQPHHGARRARGARALRG